MNIRGFGRIMRGSGKIIRGSRKIIRGSRKIARGVRKIKVDLEPYLFFPPITFTSHPGPSGCEQQFPSSRMASS